MTDAEKEEQLLNWLNEQKLTRHADKLMDPNGEVGLVSLSDLLDLSDEDLQGISETVSMNMMERKKFVRAAQSLRSPEIQAELFGKDTKAIKGASGNLESNQGAGDVEAAIAKEAGKNDQYEVVLASVSIRESPDANSSSVGTLKEGTVLHAKKERTIGGDNQVWAELTSLELKRCLAPGVQAERGFVLIDGSRIGQGLQLRGPLNGKAAGEPAAPAVDTAELQASLSAFEDVPAHADLYEAVKSVVFVMKQPDPDAPSVGCLKKGRVFHVKRELVTGVDGREWVELTNLELWRSCEPTDANDRGFALVDGTHRGLGKLVHGPIPRNANAWLSSRNMGALDANALKALKPQLPFDRLEEYANLYKVVQTMVYVKASADPDSKTLGVLKKDQVFQAFKGIITDSKGLEWVEITSYEMWKSCKPQTVDDRGYVLLNSEKLTLDNNPRAPKGPLVQGPLESREVKRWQELELDSMRSMQAQKFSERAQRKRDAEEWEKRMKDQPQNDEMIIYKYQALRDKVYMKMSEEPRYEWITQSACEPGTVFYSTGCEWRGPNGERWIDGCTVDSKKPRWLLAEDPLALGGPYMVEKMYLEEHLALSVNYMTARGPQLFETLVHKHAAVKALKERFCKSVNLSSDFVSIKAKFSPSANTPLTSLNDRGSLQEQGITPTTQLFIEYDNDLFNAMSVGRALGWLVS